MADTLDLECSVRLARQWDGLLIAAGYSVRVDPGGLSGTVEYRRGAARVLFQEYGVGFRRDADEDAASRLCREKKAGLCFCCLSDLPNAIALPLAKSFLASGARCSDEPIDLVVTAALVGFDRPAELADWTRASAGLAAFNVEGIVPQPRGPAFPFGALTGGPVAVRFSAGPASPPAGGPFHAYLELHVNRSRDRRNPTGKRFVEELVARLGTCGGFPVLLWGNLLPDACIE